MSATDIETVLKPYGLDSSGLHYNHEQYAIYTRSGSWLARLTYKTENKLRRA